MALTTLPADILPALLQLQQMLNRFWQEELRQPLPLAFWDIREDDIFFDALQYLPSCVGGYGGPRGEGHEPEDIRALPRGFQIALAIFELEDGMTCDGWIAFQNLGEERLREVAQAYCEAGLAERAATLEKLIDVYLVDPENHEALSVAADGGFPDLIDDAENSARLIAFLREDSDLKFGVLGRE